MDPAIDWSMAVHGLRRPIALLVALGLVAGCASSAGTTLAPSGPSTTPPAPTAPAASAVAGPSPVAVGSAKSLGAHLVATIDVDQGPCAVASDATMAWVTAYGAGKVDVIDLATNTVTDRISTGGTPCGIAIGPDGRLWVADLAGERVIAIDRSSGKVTATIGQLSGSLWDLKAGFGSIWVVDRLHEALLRIDPSTAAVSSSIPIGPSGGGLAVTTDAVWVADTLGGTIRRVDPTSNTARVTATVTGGATWFADDGGTHLAVSGGGQGRVTTLDPTTGASTGTIGGWVLPRDGTVLAGMAWIPDGRGHAVRVVDLGTGAIVDSYDLPGGHDPFVAEIASGDVLVLDYGATTVWRIRP